MVATLFNINDNTETRISLIFDDYEARNINNRKTLSAEIEGTEFLRMFVIHFENVPVEVDVIKIPFDGENFMNFVQNRYCHGESPYCGAKSIEDEPKIHEFGYIYGYNFISKEFLVLSNQRMNIKYDGKDIRSLNGKVAETIEGLRDAGCTYISGKVRFSLFCRRNELYYVPFVHQLDIDSYPGSGSLTKSTKV